MRNTRRAFLRLTAAAAVATGFTGQIGATAHETGTEGGSAGGSEGTKTFETELTGEAEVPPVETDASGHATFHADPDRGEVHYEVYVEGICNVTQGHIHLGKEGENGDVIAWLYPEDEQEPKLIEGPSDGVLAEGTLTEDDLIGPLEGESVDAAAQTMKEEGVYVNIHTEAYPDGEIRGQIAPDDGADDHDGNGEMGDSREETDDTSGY